MRGKITRREINSNIKFSALLGQIHNDFEKMYAISGKYWEGC